MKKLLTFFVIVLISFGANATDTFETLVKGKSCKESSSQITDCDYKIGNSFWLKIIGVGENDVGVAFMKSDYDGAYYAKIGKMHGCVIVQPNFKYGDVLDVAFVSPKTGKIYKTVEGCYKEKKI